MIRKLLMTTAISLIATSGAMAQTDTATSSTEPMAIEYMHELGEAALASNLIGETVYATEAPDAEAVGDINDLVVAQDGTIEAVVIGVGGFLGVGEKRVAVNFESIRWAEDENGERFVVFEASREDLADAPEFTYEETAEKTAMAPAEEPMTEATEEEMAAAPAEEPATTEEEAAMAPAEQSAEGEELASTDQAAMPQLRDVDAGSISADQVIGATVYATADDENVGNVGDVRLTSEGQVDAVIVDIGGFLGIGTKPVAIAFESLMFRQDEGGSFFVYTEFTREELEAAPDYDEATYDTERDAMRLTVRQ